MPQAFHSRSRNRIRLCSIAFTSAGSAWACSGWAKETRRSTIAEAYRAFRTSLLLSRAGGVRTIAITSTVPGEGKTTTALNLAVVLAQLGKRVLLVAADLHKARVHEILRISNRVGLVSILAENVPPQDVIVKINNIQTLFVIPTGPTSPNPSALLASGRPSI